MGILRQKWKLDNYDCTSPLNFSKIFCKLRIFDYSQNVWNGVSQPETITSQIDDAAVRTASLINDDATKQGWEISLKRKHRDCLIAVNTINVVSSSGLNEEYSGSLYNVYRKQDHSNSFQSTSRPFLHLSFRSLVIDCLLNKVKEVIRIIFLSQGITSVSFTE